MKHNEKTWARKWTGASVVFACALMVAVSAIAQNAQSRPPAHITKGPARLVSPQADQWLKVMGTYVGSASTYTVHADITFDHVLPSGQKLQFSANEEIVLQRPGRLYVEWAGDLGVRQLWYDGKSVTLFNPATPFFASEAAPPVIDAMLDLAASKFNFAPPLADLLYRDPYGSMRRNVLYGIDLGQNDVDGRNCRTFAFVQRDIDWQIWIENGPQPTPCKLVITYKTHPSQPQFTAVFSDWDFAPRIDPSVFVPQLPGGSQKVQFEKVAATK